MQRRERRINLLLLSPTRSGMGGPDRDWVTLANALGHERFRISWGGVEGSTTLRSRIDQRTVGRIVDLGFPLFTYLLHENAEQRRSGWLWSKIVADHLLRLAYPLARLIRMSKEDRFDIVVSNTSVVTLGSLFASLYRLPHVWFVKECLDPRIAASRRLADWIVRTSSAVVVPSRAAASIFDGRALIFPDGSDRVGIQRSASQRSRADVLASHGLPSDLPLVVQIGSLERWKGQHVTVGGVLRLAATNPRPNCSLLFLGSGSETYKREIQTILRTLSSPWQSAVRFAEFEPDDYSHIAAADIVVHPSVLPDPFPNAVREAMILGKPVIAAATGGIPEMICHERTGLLFEPNDAKALSDHLVALISSSQARLGLGRSAAAFAATQFDICTNKGPIAELLTELAVCDCRRAAETVVDRRRKRLTEPTISSEVLRG